MARKMKKLTVARLRAWLQSQPPHTKFEVRNPRTCPIAAFVDEDHLVYSTYIALHGTDFGPNDPKRIELPQWAQRFINAVDFFPNRSVDIKGNYYVSEVTRDQALEALAKAVAKENIE